jgi:altered-inheritance-of-mitochondria protein 13
VAAETTDETALSRQTVAKEVEALRAKLEERRKVREFPESVATARSEVVQCLRDNERRPLNCWMEVEKFKEEVRKLEKGWVEKVVS